MFLHPFSRKLSTSLVLTAIALLQAAPQAHAFGRGSSSGGVSTPAPQPTQPSPSVPVPVPAPAPSTTPPASATHLSVAMRSLSSGFDAARTSKVDSAAALMERILNSEEFRQAVLNFTWNGQKQFANNNGLTNSQILQTIQNGAEDLDPVVDHTADLHLELYTPNFWSAHKVVGYTDPTTLTIFMNFYFFDMYDIAEVANNLTHEWMHKLGFDHDFNATAQRPYSVPYGVGDLVESIGERILGNSGASVGN